MAKKPVTITLSLKTALMLARMLRMFAPNTLLAAELEAVTDLKNKIKGSRP